MQAHFRRAIYDALAARAPADIKVMPAPNGREPENREVRILNPETAEYDMTAIANGQWIRDITFTIDVACNASAPGQDALDAADECQRMIDLVEDAIYGGQDEIEAAVEEADPIADSLSALVTAVEGPMVGPHEAEGFVAWAFVTVECSARRQGTPSNY